jgi:uncharacterized membrane protein
VSDFIPNLFFYLVEKAPRIMEHQVETPDTSAIHSYKYGWQQMKKFFWPLLLVMLVFVLAELPAGLADYEVNDDFQFEPVTPIQIIGTLYWLLVLPVFQYGLHYLFLRAARNQSFEVKEILNGFNNYINIVLANLLVIVLVGVGLVLFIIPGIIAFCRLAFVPYIVMDQKLSPVEAVKKSWKITRGHAWTIFGMGLLAIPIIIGGVLLLLVGVIFAAMWILTAFAGLFYAVTLNQESINETSISGEVQS